MTTYEPREHGADCDNCPLNEEKVVPPQLQAASLLVVGEAPGNQEVEQGRPFVGASGKELERTLWLHGFHRGDVSLTNTLLCRPPGGNLHQYLGRVRRRGQKSPIDCCRPRLLREVKAAKGLLLLGATAKGAVAGDSSEQGLLRMRGFPTTTAGKPAVATVHPAFVLRSRRWTETFRSDVGKALRHVQGKCLWKAPDIVLDPSPDELDSVLSRVHNSLVAVDVETDGLDPQTCNLRCVGLGTEDLVVVAGFHSVENPARSWRIDVERARERLRNFFSIHKRLSGHNINVYDRPVLERHGMPLPDFVRVGDSVVMHHVVDSELPHDLDYLSSRYTDAPKHKPGHGHDEWTSDLDLHHYCALDVAITASLVPMLERRVIETDQVRVYLSDVELQRLCVGMHKAGMQIDEGERMRHELRLRVKMKAAQERAERVLEREINLASPDQVRDLLYEKWALRPPEEETESGVPSTNKDAIYGLLQQTLPVPIVEFLDALLEYRAAARSLAKDVLGINPDAQGRVHPFWSPHSVVTGRLSSSSPQVQNVPGVKLDTDSLRSMYVAASGSVLVGCDLEQLELRLVAFLSNDHLWLDAFASGADVHKLNAAVFFGKPADSISKWERDFGKTVCYMFLYGGGPRRAQINMQRVRDPRTGERPYAKMTLDEARTLRDRLLRAHPALPAWWQATVDEFRTRHLLRSVLLGRVRRFLDGGESGDDARQEIINYRIQATGADIMSGTYACGKLMYSVGWPFGPGDGMRGAGIIHHGHDSLMVEVDERRVDDAIKALEDAMTMSLSLGERGILIPAKAKAGWKWSEL